MLKLEWEPVEGWWTWQLPGETELLRMVSDPVPEMTHRMRDSIW